MFVPEIELAPDTVRDGVLTPVRGMPFTELGVMSPSVKVKSGVVVGFATTAETPLAVVTETKVTVPDEPEGEKKLNGYDRRFIPNQNGIETNPKRI